MSIGNKNYIVGADEVGYGALAGMVCVCAVRAPKDWILEGLNDSKKLSKKKRGIMRDKLSKLVEQGVIQFSMAERSNVEIDAVGVATALRDCYAEVFIRLHDTDCLLIADGNIKFGNLAVRGYYVVSEPKADTKYPAVMAASIIAKEWRDDKMHTLHHTYPNYGWDHNVGYGSKDHLQAIAQHGPCPLHRFSYAPMRNMEIEDPNQLDLGFDNGHQQLP